MFKIASVVLSSSTRQFDKEYSYLVGESLYTKVIPGVRVMVPFGKSNRTVEAFVMSVTEESEQKEDLKQIKEVIDDRPVLSGNMIELCRWMKDRYICTYADAIKSMLPSGIRVKSSKFVRLSESGEALKGTSCSSTDAKLNKIIEIIKNSGGCCEYDELKNVTGSRGFSSLIKRLEENGIVEVYEEFSPRISEKTVRAAFLTKSPEEVIDEIESNKIRRIQHIKVLELLLENEYIPLSDIVNFSGVSLASINTLKKNGYIDFCDIEVKRDPYQEKYLKKTHPLKLTEEQKNALDRLIGHVNSSGFKEVLLHGVTGSGKTEVYLQIIDYVIKKGKQAIVLVPEISLTPQMVERFKGRFGDEVAVLHSRLSLGERYDQWRMIRDGAVKVAVGARSAIFAPFQKLGIVIIDEEHESSYKSEVTPKYHAADVARQRCLYDDAVLLYGSATPSVETYYRAMKGQIELIEMKERANKQLLPKVCVVDMRKELDNGNRSIFSDKLEAEMRKNISDGQQTILFLNRRGYASFVLCRECGYTLKCSYCNVSLTYHSNNDRLICHYCGYTIKNPSLCPKCKSKYIRQFGIGTQKVEEEVIKHFEGCTVIRMDADTTSCKNSHEEILNKFKSDNINVLVGTQMIAKGHDFPNVTLVGVLAADSMLNQGDYKASERTFQLITQVAGRAGRGEIPGRVVIQTYNTDDFSIAAACRQDYKEFYRQEIIIRERLNYPPFTHIASVIFGGPVDREVYKCAKEFKNILAAGFENYNAEILGPARAPITKIKNKYRWRIVIKCSNLDRIIDVLANASDDFNKNKAKSNITLSMDINPTSML